MRSTRPPVAVGVLLRHEEGTPHVEYIYIGWDALYSALVRSPCALEVPGRVKSHPTFTIWTGGGTLAEPRVWLVIHNITVECYPQLVADCAYPTQGLVPHTAEAGLHIGTEQVDSTGYRMPANAFLSKKDQVLRRASARLIAEIGPIPLPFSNFLSASYVMY